MTPLEWLSGLSEEELQDRQGKGVKHQESALDYMDG